MNVLVIDKKRNFDEKGWEKQQQQQQQNQRPAMKYFDTKLVWCHNIAVCSSSLVTYVESRMYHSYIERTN